MHLYICLHIFVSYVCRLSIHLSTHPLYLLFLLCVFVCAPTPRVCACLKTLTNKEGHCKELPFLSFHCCFCKCIWIYLSLLLVYSQMQPRDPRWEIWFLFSNMPSPGYFPQTSNSIKVLLVQAYCTVSGDVPSLFPILIFLPPLHSVSLLTLRLVTVHSDSENLESTHHFL